MIIIIIIQENIYKLASIISDSITTTNTTTTASYVVFVSSKKQKTPIWGQRLCTNTSSPVVWDYHVLFLIINSDKKYIYDYDSILSFPCSALEYCKNSFLSPDNSIVLNGNNNCNIYLSFINANTMIQMITLSTFVLLLVMIILIILQVIVVI